MCLCVSCYCCCVDEFNHFCEKSGLLKNFHKLINNPAVVNLGLYDKSAALIHQSWNSSNFKHLDECHFNVIATLNKEKPTKRGLFVSIRKLNLRKSLTSDDCVDFIQFKFGDKKSPKFCGQLNASTDSVEKIFFGEGAGVIGIFIYIDKFLPMKRLEDTLDIELVFTAHDGRRTIIYQF